MATQDRQISTCKNCGATFLDDNRQYGGKVTLCSTCHYRMPGLASIPNFSETTQIQATPNVPQIAAPVYSTANETTAVATVQPVRQNDIVTQIIALFLVGFVATIFVGCLVLAMFSQRDNNTKLANLQKAVEAADRERNVARLEQMLDDYLEQVRLNRLRDPGLMEQLNDEARRISYDKTGSGVDTFHVIKNKPFDKFHELYECFIISTSQELIAVNFVVKDNRLVRTESVDVRDVDIAF